jgi:hypothetical protein
MADFENIIFIDPVNNRRSPLSFLELVSLIKGSSIKSMATANDFFELGLTDGFNLRIESGLQLSLFSTLNKGENPPLRLQIIAKDEMPTARLVEERIHALRQMYALSYLLERNRSQEAADVLEKSTAADLEDRLPPDDRMLISAASEGSFWLTVLTKTKGAFKTLSHIAPLFFEESREAIVRRVRAGTKLKELEAQEKEISLSFQSANKLIDLVKQVDAIKDADTRERVRQALATNAKSLGHHLPPALPKPEAGGATKKKRKEQKSSRRKR